MDRRTTMMRWLLLLFSSMPAAAAPAMIAIWASLSDEADARVREQIQAGVFRSG
jgi:hypothetical protein